MGFSLKNFLGGVARTGLALVTGGPLAAVGTAVSEISGASRRSNAQARSPGYATSPQLPVPFSSGAGRRTSNPPPFVGGGGGFGSGGAGGNFGPQVYGPSTGIGAGTKSAVYGNGNVSVATAPAFKSVVAPRPGFVTVTLPYSMFGFPAGSKIQLLKELARSLKLWRPKPRPKLTAGDVKTLTKADRIQSRLVNYTRKYATDYTVMTDTAAKNLRQNQRPKSQRRR